MPPGGSQLEVLTVLVDKDGHLEQGIHDEVDAVEHGGFVPLFVGETFRMDRMENSHKGFALALPHVLPDTVFDKFRYSARHLYSIHTSFPVIYGVLIFKCPPGHSRVVLLVIASLLHSPELAERETAKVPSDA
ncbi:hypothetical protein PSP6_260075 [Paraburkholderia tropica]|nr:hypothetical protein PSP6_260075 [Paraburkholderia tropica]